jgi:hypothetical protein
MRCKLLRAGQFLVLAGLTSVGSLWADEQLPSSALPTTLSRDGSQVIVVEAAKARTWAMQIELELLGDPATFPYALKPQANAKGMEIIGYVPNAVVLDRALALARKVCPMHVADGMIVQRNMSLPMPALMPEDIIATIHERLWQVVSAQVATINVKAADSGAVVLTGQVESFRDKLECSRCLRGLKGVTSIKNDLLALDAPQAVASGVTQAVYVPEPLSQPVLPASKPPAAAVFADPIPIQAVELTQSSYLPRALPNEKPLPAVPSAAPSSTGRVGGWLRQVQGAGPVSQQRSSVRSSIMPPVPVPPAKGTLSKEVAAQEAAAAGAAEDIQPVTAKTDGAKSEPPEMLPPPVAANSAPASAPPKASAPSGQKPMGMPSARAQNLLRSKIRTAVGKSARQVEVQFRDGGIGIMVQLPNHASHDQVIESLMRIPEVQTYLPNVSIDVKMEGAPPATGTGATPRP